MPIKKKPERPTEIPPKSQEFTDQEIKDILKSALEKISEAVLERFKEEKKLNETKIINDNKKV